MFQTFSATTSSDQGPPRLQALRDLLRIEKLDGYLVPRADRHQGEYVAPCDERLAWLTGFTGSAGFCAVLQDRAGLFVDGRYRVQGRAQAAAEFDIVAWPEVKLADWLKENQPSGTIGFDPWLHSVHEIRKLRDALEGTDLKLQPGPNLIDQIWPDRPPRPKEPVRVFPLEHAGESHGDKRRRLGAQLQEANEASAVITLPDSVAWLLNIRGGDIPRTPIAQAFAVLRPDGKVDLFTDAPINTEVREHLGLDIGLRELDALEGYLAESPLSFQIDPASAPEAVRLILNGRSDGTIKTFEEADPCALPKACKTAAELAGTRAAHHRDAAAMVEFMAWLDGEVPESLTEIDVVKSLEGFRRATNALQDISFETIAGSGPNAAIVHYRVNEDTNRQLAGGELLLVDSGGQYLDGTTDITRTIALGQPNNGHISAFTSVLRGMIALSRARFPQGVAGRDLDALARQHLWSDGLDYDHGTGHGVGVYLSVHEGPQRISRVSGIPLEPGMIVSNEPGYYREGEFGIRIENLIVVREAPEIAGQDDRPWRDFETLTWVPIDRNLIDVAQLAPAELDWINGYHQEVARVLEGRVSEGAADWLSRATAVLT